MNLLIRFIISTIAVAVTARLLPGVSIDSFTTLLIASLVLGVINTFVKPILIFLTLPINIATLGLFSVIINALLILLASRIVDGFDVQNFMWALIFSVVLSLVSGFLNLITPDGKED